MRKEIDQAIDYINRKDGPAPIIVTTLALIGMGRLARLAALGLAAFWVADHIRTIEKERALFRPSEDDIDAASEDSFPASDAPSYGGATAGAPEEELKTA
jgi:hypothetical protein